MQLKSRPSFLAASVESHPATAALASSPPFSTASASVVPSVMVGTMTCLEDGVGVDVDVGAGIAVGACLGRVACCCG